MMNNIFVGAGAGAGVLVITSTNFNMQWVRRGLLQ